MPDTDPPTPTPSSVHAMEKSLLAYIQKWLPAATSFAAYFSSQRVAVPGWLGSKGTEAMLQSMKEVFAQFVAELNATVTQLEMAALIADLRTLQSTHGLAPLDEAQALMLSAIMSPQIPPLDLEDDSGGGLLRGMATGAGIGMAAGAPLVGLGALPGAIFGGMVGVVFGGTMKTREWAKLTKFRIIGSVPEAARHLQMQRHEAMQFLLAHPARRSDASPPQITPFPRPSDGGA